MPGRCLKWFWLFGFLFKIYFSWNLPDDELGIVMAVSANRLKCCGG